MCILALSILMLLPNVTSLLLGLKILLFSLLAGAFVTCHYFRMADQFHQTYETCGTTVTFT